MPRKTNISPLVAARVRPIRMSPNGLPAGAGVMGASRKEGCGAVGRGRERDANADAGKRAKMQDAVNAVRTTLSALEKVYSLLQSLEKTLRRAKEGRRKPPSGAKGLQDRIQATAFAIDAVVQQMADDDQSAGEAPLGFAGPVKECAFLATIRAGGARSLEHASVGEVHAIVEQTAARVQAQCRDLASFLAEKLEPASKEQEIAEENRAATLAAVEDGDFAQATGRISGGDLLLHVLNLRAEQRRESEAAPPAFRLVTEPEQSETHPE